MRAPNTVSEMVFGYNCAALSQTHAELGCLTHSRGRGVVRRCVLVHHPGQVGPGVRLKEVAGLILLVITGGRSVLSGFDKQLEKRE